MEATEIIDPELIGHRLDLSRPELHPILNRYFPRSALFVGRQAPASSFKEALIGDAWLVRKCEGPVTSSEAVEAMRNGHARHNIIKEGRFRPQRLDQRPLDCAPS